MTAGRAERRRAERASAKAHRRQPVVYLGDNIAAVGLGQRYEAKPRTDFDPKEQGAHRWAVFACWKTSPEVAALAYDPDRLKLLDNENLIELGIACIDCEQPLGPDVAADSLCPAGDEWIPKKS